MFSRLFGSITNKNTEDNKAQELKETNEELDDKYTNTQELLEEDNKKVNTDKKSRVTFKKIDLSRTITRDKKYKDEIMDNSTKYEKDINGSGEDLEQYEDISNNDSNTNYYNTQKTPYNENETDNDTRYFNMNCLDNKYRRNKNQKMSSDVETSMKENNSIFSEDINENNEERKLKQNYKNKDGDYSYPKKFGISNNDYLENDDFIENQDDTKSRIMDKNKYNDDIQYSREFDNKRNIDKNDISYSSTDSSSRYRDNVIDNLGRLNIKSPNDKRKKKYNIMYTDRDDEFDGNEKSFHNDDQDFKKFNKRLLEINKNIVTKNKDKEYLDDDESDDNEIIQNKRKYHRNNSYIDPLMESNKDKDYDEYKMRENAFNELNNSFEKTEIRYDDKKTLLDILNKLSEYIYESRSVVKLQIKKHMEYSQVLLDNPVSSWANKYKKISYAIAETSQVINTLNKHTSKVIEKGIYCLAEIDKADKQLVTLIEDDSDFVTKINNEQIDKLYKLNKLLKDFITSSKKILYNIIEKYDDMGFAKEYKRIIEKHFGKKINTYEGNGDFKNLQGDEFLELEKEIYEMTFKDQVLKDLLDK